MKYVLSAELTIYEVFELQAELEALLGSLQEDLVIDGSQVVELDSAGIQLLIWLTKGITSQGGKVSYSCLSDTLAEALDFCELPYMDAMQKEMMNDS